MKAVSGLSCDRLDLAGGFDVFGQVEIVNFRLGCGFGDRDRQMERRAREHARIFGEQGDERLCRRWSTTAVETASCFSTCCNCSALDRRGRGSRRYVQHARRWWEPILRTDDDDVSSFVSRV